MGTNRWRSPTKGLPMTASAAVRKSMSSIGKRRLGLALKEARLQAQLSLEQAAEEIGDWGKNKVHKWEQGSWVRGYRTDLEVLLKTYQVTDPDQVNEFVAMLDEAKQAQARFAQFADVYQGSYPAFEREATDLMNYESSWVPGLIQCPEYIERVTGTMLGVGEEPSDGTTMQRRLAARRERQRVLSDPHKSFWFVFQEQAIDQLASDPELHRAQIEHLLALPSASGIRVQMVPTGGPIHAATGTSFVILDYPEEYELSILYSEGGLGQELVDDRGSVAAYRKRFMDVCGAALSTQKTRVELARKLDAREEG